MTDNRRRLLPPIGALASFVAAARHDSFSRAGQEMGLTQSAVSRQIAHLEDWLQLRLFDRNGRRVELSREGEAYLKAIGPALEQIRAATAAAISGRSDKELNIATLPSFGMRWLAPRLPRLTARHPDIIVNFSARTFPFSFAHEAFDGAIHFGDIDWPGGAPELLFHEESILVCAPDRLRRQPIAKVADLLEWPLLVQAERRSAWKIFLDRAGVDQEPPAPSASFEHFLMLAQAAAAGAGAALIPKFLIGPELAAGTLVSPLAETLAAEHGYYFVVPEGQPLSPSLTIFRDWLLEEARTER
ncbi:LysR substrate-binding domain-containing protein [Porphyrobacter sp. YT40]|uniref:LysR substrate-binding domain-containing protein n=1 Tax=Porphyrobacter sp. YT40 TaxID=2547601 RepID=UPI0011443039|nr:LysR substrate-binding domain-containing protein [Porphyrobacter sp. YT40]QDH33680.1 LysR family transcriptional regulator [Porphyrobacter sp. YT40]